MKSFNIRFETVDRVKTFVNITSKFDAEFELRQGKYIVDGKSILGILALELSENIGLVISPETPEVITALKDYLGA